MFRLLNDFCVTETSSITSLMEKAQGKDRANPVRGSACSNWLTSGRVESTASPPPASSRPRGSGACSSHLPEWNKMGPTLTWNFLILRIILHSGPGFSTWRNECFAYIFHLLSLSSHSKVHSVCAWYMWVTREESPDRATVDNFGKQMNLSNRWPTHLLAVQASLRGLSFCLPRPSWNPSSPPPFLLYFFLSLPLPSLFPFLPFFFLCVLPSLFPTFLPSFCLTLFLFTFFFFPLQIMPLFKNYKQFA